MSASIVSTDNKGTARLSLLSILSRYKLYVLAAVIIASFLLIQHFISSRNLTIAKTDTMSGVSLYEKGDFKAAIPKLENAASLNPSDATTKRSLAQSYEATGKLDQAAKAYQASLAINPKQPEVHYNLAIIYKSQGKTKLAIAELERAIKLNKQFVAAKIIIGDLYVQQGLNDKAKEQYQAVIDLKPFGVDLEGVKRKLMLTLEEGK